MKKFKISSIAASLFVACVAVAGLASCGDDEIKPENGNVPGHNDSYSYNGHEYVDLGLSVKWATCNVGASSPEEYGDYYAWGETETKSTYNWSTYIDSPNRDGNSFTKYYNNGGKTQLDPDDDVAHVKWKGTWRMPTDTELTELRTMCKWTWNSTKKGYTVEGPNGNSIFLPAAGYRSGGSLYNAGSRGVYWSSSLDTSGSNDAYSVYFNSSNVDRYDNGRFYGRSVRPVCP